MTVSVGFVENVLHALQEDGTIIKDDTSTIGSFVDVDGSTSQLPQSSFALIPSWPDTVVIPRTVDSAPIIDLVLEHPLQPSPTRTTAAWTVSVRQPTLADNINATPIAGEQGFSIV
jgi:hypothetical protein